jgi:hypothetical protein
LAKKLIADNCFFGTRKPDEGLKRCRVLERSRSRCPRASSTQVEGNTVLVEGPKGKVSALIAEGITLETKDGVLHVNRENDKQAAVHGLTRALVFNAVQGVTTGWKKRTGHRGHRLSRRVEGQGHGGLHAGLFAPHRGSAAHGHRSGHRSQADFT